MSAPSTIDNVSLPAPTGCLLPNEAAIDALLARAHAAHVAYDRNIEQVQNRFRERTSLMQVFMPLSDTASLDDLDGLAQLTQDAIPYAAETSEMANKARDTVKAERDVIVAQIKTWKRHIATEPLSVRRTHRQLINQFLGAAAYVTLEHKVSQSDRACDIAAMPIRLLRAFSCISSP